MGEEFVKIKLVIKKGEIISCPDCGREFPAQKTIVIFENDPVDIVLICDPCMLLYEECEDEDPDDDEEDDFGPPGVGVLL